MKRLLFIIVLLFAFSTANSKGVPIKIKSQSAFIVKTENLLANVADSVVYQTTYIYTTKIVVEVKNLIKVDLNDYLSSDDDNGTDWNYTEIGDYELSILKSNKISYFSNNIQGREYRDWETDRKSTRLNSSHRSLSRMPSSA